jgi:hypothetical protein
MSLDFKKIKITGLGDIQLIHQQDFITGVVVVVY